MHRDSKICGDKLIGNHLKSSSTESKFHQWFEPVVEVIYLFWLDVRYQPDQRDLISLFWSSALGHFRWGSSSLPICWRWNESAMSQRSWAWPRPIGSSNLPPSISGNQQRSVRDADLTAIRTPPNDSFQFVNNVLGLIEQFNGLTKYCETVHCAMQGGFNKNLQVILKNSTKQWFFFLHPSLVLKFF